jgi:signal transduction histidine kinase
LSSRQFDELLQLYNIKNDLTKRCLFEMGDLLTEIRSVLELSSGRELISAQRWPLLLCERHLMRQILLNLISNGFKFNCAALKRVEVGWQPAAENRIELFVRDNGIGIESQNHSRIFKIFKRLHTEREYEGTGIGLAIVKKAATKMGDAVRLESTPGKGSTFYVDLPLSVATAGDGAGSTGTQPRDDSGSG